jgi:hypothetical protein
MDDQNLTTLLQKTAADFDPSRAHVDLDQARKSGRRRQLLTHIAAPAGSALALAAIAAGLFAATPHGTIGGASTMQMTSALPTANASYASHSAVSPTAEMLTLPATFGWLPAGFSPLKASIIPTPAEVTSASGKEVMTTSKTDNQELISAGTADQSRDVNLNVIEGKQSGITYNTVTAPDVNGKPAKWFGGGIEWEYAPGEWAILMATGNVSAGWTGVKTLAGPVTPATTPTQTKTDLYKIATHIQWGKHQFQFPYQFTHDLPSPWAPVSTSGQYTDGHLVATIVRLGLSTASFSSDILDIDVQPFSSKAPTCTGPSSQTHYIEADGVQWKYQAQDDYATEPVANSATASKYAPVQGLCSVGPVDGQSVQLLLNLDKVTETWKGNIPTSVTNTPNPGVSEIGSGGVKTMLSWMKFLGSTPATWTTNPFGN